MGSFSYIHINTWLDKTQKLGENKDNLLKFQSESLVIWQFAKWWQGKAEKNEF